MSERMREFVADELWLVFAVLTLPIAGLGAVLSLPFVPEVTGIIGWFLLTPLFLFWGEDIATMLYGPPQDSNEAVQKEDPVELLKRKYASGEISEEEFERRLDTLLDIDVKLEEADTSEQEVDRSRVMSEPER